MAPTIKALMSCVPTKLWKSVKSVFSGRMFEVMGFPFKMSTKYTTIILILMNIAALSANLASIEEFECTVKSLFKGGPTKEEVTTYCKNVDTYLVRRGLTPEMREYVIHPGVTTLREGDEKIVQHSYKLTWMILIGLTAISIFPLTMWKVMATRKVTSFIGPESRVMVSPENLATRFLEAVGLNNSLGYVYLLTYLLATFAPLSQMYVLYLIVGPDYLHYGWKTLRFLMNEGKEYPNPQDVLYPKISSCRWMRVGITGDQENFDVVCQLGMNSVFRWVFLVIWWWILVVAFVNAISTILICLYCLPCYRKFVYKQIMKRVCVPHLKNTINGENGDVIGQFRIITNIRFGDHVMLAIVKRAIDARKFRQMIRAIAEMPNSTLAIAFDAIPLKEV